MEKNLRIAVLVGIFSIPLFALFVANASFFPFITGKNFAFRIIVELITAGWLLLALANTQYRPRRSIILYAVLGITAVTTLSAIFGENVYKSFWSDFERMEGLVAQLHIALYFLVTISMLTTEKLWQRFLQTSLATSVLVAGVAYLQYFGFVNVNQGNVRLDATFGNATYLAVYLLFHVFFCAYFYFQAETTKRAKILYVLVALFELFPLYRTATRGALLGLIGGAFLTFILVTIFQKGRARKFAIGGVVAVLVLVGVFFSFRHSAFVTNSQVLSRFASISLTDNTTKARVIIWGMAFQGFKEHPLLGWGPENFNVVFNKYFDPRLYDQEQWFDHAHNIVIDWMTMGGILGLLAYLSLFAAAVWVLWRNPNTFSHLEKSIITGLLAGYLFNNLFVFDNLYSAILFYTVLGLIYSRVIPREKDVPVFSGKVLGDGTGMNVAVSAVIIVLIFGVYFVNVKPILANSALLQGLNLQSRDPKTSLQFFRRAVSYNTFAETEIGEQLALASMRLTQNPQAKVEDKSAFFDLARTTMTDVVTRSPNDAREFLIFGNFLRIHGQYDEAAKALDRALELSPKKQLIFFEKGAWYLDQQKYKEASEMFRAAYELAPQFEMARNLYAASLVYLGDMQASDALLVGGYGTTTVVDDRLLSAYASTKRYDRVIAQWQMRVNQDPTAPQPRLSLAASYVAAGNRTAAIAEIQKVIAGHPEFATQGQYYINEIRAGRMP